MNMVSLTPRTVNMEQVGRDRSGRGGSRCIKPSDFLPVLTGNESVETVKQHDAITYW